MINKVILVGRITKDVELRKTNSSTSVVSFTLACNRRYTSAQGNGPTADFINCVAWRQSADFLAKYAHKGDIVGVEGNIQTRNYDGQNGKVYVTEVVCDNVQLIGGSRSNSGETAQREPAPSYNNNNQNAYAPRTSSFQNKQEDDVFSNTPSLDISSDDLPFY